MHIWSSHFTMAHDRPLLIGLTGSIAMGKTETAGMFARLGIPVYDADKAVHRLYDKGGAAVPEVAKAFPECVLDGRVDRVRLGARVGHDKDAFDRLEAIVHPLVARDQLAFLEDARAKGAEMVVLDIPLLFETGAQSRMDAVVVVSAPDAVQRARVLARADMTEEKLAGMLARQMPNTEKRALAHYVVETGDGLDSAFQQVKAIVSALGTRLRAKENDAHA